MMSPFRMTGTLVISDLVPPHPDRPLQLVCHWPRNGQDRRNHSGARRHEDHPDPDRNQLSILLRYIPRPVARIGTVRFGCPQPTYDDVAHLAHRGDVKPSEAQHWRAAQFDKRWRTSLQELAASRAILRPLCGHNFPERLVLSVRKSCMKHDTVITQHAILLLDDLEKLENGLV